MEKAYESMFGIKRAGPGCTKSMKPPCSLNTPLYRAHFHHLAYSIWNHVYKAIFNALSTESIKIQSVI